MGQRDYFLGIAIILGMAVSTPTVLYLASLVQIHLGSGLAGIGLVLGHALAAGVMAQRTFYRGSDRQRVILGALGSSVLALYGGLQQLVFLTLEMIATSAQKTPATNATAGGSAGAMGSVDPLASVFTPPDILVPIPLLTLLSVMAFSLPLVSQVDLETVGRHWLALYLLPGICYLLPPMMALSPY